MPKKVWGIEKLTPEDLNGTIDYLEALAGGALSGQFAQDADTTAALVFGYKGGNFRNDNTITVIADGTVNLTDATTNYVEVDAAGVTANTTGFTSGKAPLFEITTADGAINTVTDKRAWITPNVAGITAINATAPITSTGTTTKTIGISAATTSTAGSMSGADKTKLDGVATGATANSTDADLLNRANHTGTQAISTVTDLQTTLDAKADLEAGKVPASQLPSYVDDVLIYADLASFPGTGEDGKIYVAEDTNKTYRWSGSSYVEVGGGGVALGETSSTAYRGDRGKIAYDHSQLTSGNPHSVTLSDLSVTATATELNYVAGVTSAIQTQLNAKAADSDVVKLTGAQTVAGVKTFSDSPIVPAPTTDYQTATKKYVDDNSDGSGYIAKDVAGSSDVTLTATESQNGNIKLTGAITANINVIPFDATMRMWRIYNETSGAFTVTFKTAAGTGIAITQGAAALLECDGTNVVEISTGGASAINDLTDVTITTPSTGQALKWDGTAWINSTIATGAVNFIGAWATSTSYALDDGVSNNGSSYVCISAHTSSATDEPGVGVNTATYWMLLAAKGEPGADGADGTNGTNGTDGAGYGGTSTTSFLIGTGSKAFTTQSGLAYVPGSIVKAVSDANAANWMQGEVTSYTGTTLTINVDTVGGSGTLADWSFTIAGVDGTNTISISDGTTTTSNVDTIEFDGATVTDNTNGSVTVSGFSGGGGGSVDIRDIWLFA